MTEKTLPVYLSLEQAAEDVPVGQDDPSPHRRRHRSPPTSAGDVRSASGLMSLRPLYAASPQLGGDARRSRRRTGGLSHAWPNGSIDPMDCWLRPCHRIKADA